MLQRCSGGTRRGFSLAPVRPRGAPHFPCSGRLALVRRPFFLVLPHSRASKMHRRSPCAWFAPAPCTTRAHADPTAPLAALPADEEMSRPSRLAQHTAEAGWEPVRGLLLYSGSSTRLTPSLEDAAVRGRLRHPSLALARRRRPPLPLHPLRLGARHRAGLSRGGDGHGRCGSVVGREGVRRRAERVQASRSYHHRYVVPDSRSPRCDSS